MIFFTGTSFVEHAFDFKTPAGAYVAWLLTSKTAQDMYDFANYVGVVDIVPPHEMHATIVYAPNSRLESDIHGDHALPLPVMLTHHNRPATRVLGQAGESGALVTSYDSDRLFARHHYWTDEVGLRHAHPDFIPHVTLSYDAARQRREVVRHLLHHPYGGEVSFDRERIAYAGKGS